MTAPVKIDEALHFLNDFETPTAIADYLESQGIKGRPSRCSTCPTAMYFQQRCNYDNIFVFGDVVSVMWTIEGQDGNFTRDYGLSDAVGSFIIEFDAGKYPDLEAEDDGGTN